MGIQARTNDFTPPVRFASEEGIVLQRTFAYPSMGVTTMKTTSLRIIGALLVLSVLWGMVPSVRADDAIDHANEIGRYQAELWQETVKGQEDQQKLADYLT